MLSLDGLTLRSIELEAHLYITLIPATGGGKVVLYKAGSFTPFAYDFDINDGTCSAHSPIAGGGASRTNRLVLAIS